MGSPVSRYCRRTAYSIFISRTQMSCIEMIQKDVIPDCQGALAIGYGTFPSTTPTHERSLICSPDIVTILTAVNWTLNYKFGNKWATVFACMSQATCQRLELRWNERPQIIMDINSVNYLQLRSLLLPSNGIRNIEALEKINAPQLQQTSLCFNQIISWKGLRRAHFPSLETLSIYSNFCLQGAVLVETLQNASIKTLVVDSYLGMDKKYSLIEDMSFLNKMKAVGVRKVDYHQSRRRINQKMLAGPSNFLKQRG